LASEIGRVHLHCGPGKELINFIPSQLAPDGATIEEEQDDERERLDDEQPTVVVLKEGDLTKEEAERVERELESKRKPI